MLEVLLRHGVDFIVVGGVSAILQGAQLMTYDLDIVHARNPENIGRVLAALQELDAWYRLRTDQKIVPKESHLASPAHQLLETNLGSLDVLGTIDDGKTYEDLKPYSSSVPAGSGVVVVALSLEKLLEVKERAGRAKDRAVLELIRAAIVEQKGQA